MWPDAGERKVKRMSVRTTDIGWIGKGRERRCDEGVFAYKVVLSEDLRKDHGAAPPPRFAVMRTLKPRRDPADHFYVVDYFPDEGSAIAAAEGDLRALKSLRRRQVARGSAGAPTHEPVFSFGPGLFVVDDYGSQFRLSEELVQRMPTAFRKPARDGYAVYDELETELVIHFMPELFTPLEIAQADGILDEYPRFTKLHKAQSPPSTKRLLRTHLGLDTCGWNFDRSMRIVSVGRPEADDRMKVVLDISEFAEYCGPHFYDLRGGDRIVVMIPAENLARTDFSLDFDRHEVVGYQPAPDRRRRSARS